MRFRVFVASAVLAFGFVFSSAAGFAKPISDKTKNALDHMAQVMVVETNCSKVQSNSSKIAIVMTLFSVNLDDPDQKKYITQRVAYHSSDLKKLDEASICMAGLVLYGPQGVNVPGLIEKK